MATFLGASGVELEFDLPLSEPYANQVLKGELTPADDDAHDYAATLSGTGGMRQPTETSEAELDEATPEAPEATEPDETPEPEPELAERPPESGRGSSRKAWAAWAQSQGVEVDDEDTRDDIIAKMDG